MSRALFVILCTTLWMLLIIKTGSVFAANHNRQSPIERNVQRQRKAHRTHAESVEQLSSPIQSRPHQKIGHRQANRDSASLASQHKHLNSDGSSSRRRFRRTKPRRRDFIRRRKFHRLKSPSSSRRRQRPSIRDFRHSKTPLAYDKWGQAEPDNKGVGDCPVDPVPPPANPDGGSRLGISSGMTCSLRMVADASFVQIRGRGLADRARIEMIAYLNYVNVLFRRTRFRDEDGQMSYDRIGFQPGEIVILENEGSRESDYNSALPSIGDTLRSFATIDAEQNSEHCGGLLFTARDHIDCTSYTASYIGDRTNDTGVCATKRSVDPEQQQQTLSISPNVAVVNAIPDKIDWRLEFVQSVAHALGGLFGALADQSSDRGIDGNPSIMALPFNDDRTMNISFSERSIELMSEFLAYRSGCFAKVGSCGDAVVDPGEACDEGRRGGPCCDSSCRLKAGAVCSDQNHACCSLCRLAPESRLCRQSDYRSCRDVARCNGSSEVCPEVPAVNGTLCRNFGVCRDGECLSICEMVHLKNCSCQGVNECKVCCEDNGQCKLFKPELYLEDGSECMKHHVVGRCVQRRCQTEDLPSTVTQSETTGTTESTQGEVTGSG